MRNIIMMLIASFCLASGLTAAADRGKSGGNEVKRRSFLKGSYSLEIPAGWQYEIDEADLSLSVSSGDHAAVALVVLKPDFDIKQSQLKAYADELVKRAESESENTRLISKAKTKFGKYVGESLEIAIQESGQPLKTIHYILFAAHDCAFALLVVTDSANPDTVERETELMNAVVNSLRIDAQKLTAAKAWLTGDSGEDAQDTAADVNDSNGREESEKTADDTEEDGEDPSLSDVGSWGDPQVSQTRQWTILVYLDGDNDLEKFALQDLKEMERGIASCSPGLVDVVVLFDRAKGYANGMGDWTDTRVFHVEPSKTPKSIDSTLLNKCGELNMASPATLENFVAEGMRMFPAPRTALFLWNHGGGWSVLLSDDDARGTKDQEPASMTLEDVRVALSRAAVNFPDGKLDLVAFDMCLMGQAETLVALAPYVKYMVASPPLAPGIGMDYEKGVPLFSRGMQPPEIAEGLVRTTCQTYQEKGQKSGSFAAYDLSRVGGLLSSFAGLARKFNTLVPIAWPHLTRAIFYANNFGGREDLEQRSGSTSSVDLLDWLGRLKKISDPALAAEFAGDIAAVEKAVKDVLIYSESGPAMRNSNGLAIYAPLREGNMDEDYGNNSFGVYTGWLQALNDLHQEQTDNAGSPPRISGIEFGVPAGGKKARNAEISDIATADVVRTGDDASEYLVKLTVDGINILWVSSGFALSKNAEGPYTPMIRKTILNENIVAPSEAQKGITAADDSIPVFRDGRNVFISRFDGALKALSNGKSEALAYPQYLDQANPESAIILAFFREADGDDWQPVILETDGDEVVQVYSISLDSEEDVVTTVITPNPDDQFWPSLTTIDDEGDEEDRDGDSIRWGKGLTLVDAVLPEGQYIKVMCSAESLAGEGSTKLSDPIKIGK